MELMARLARWSLKRPRVLLVDAPGATELRWYTEAELDRRGWPTAVSPADTDLLLVLGSPEPELATAIDVLWNQVPHPRWHTAVEDRATLGTVLDDAFTALTDTGDQRSAAARAPADPWHGARDDVEDADGVAGLAMAGMAPDRDGLELDALTVHLGPVLPGWPTGLVVRATLQGDVLTEVRVFGPQRNRRKLPGASAAAAAGEVLPVVLALDGLHRFLLVAGWPAEATAARRLRDRLLGHGPQLSPADRRRASRLVDRIRTSRTLAWSVGGIGRLPATAGAAGLADPVAGDALDRVRRWCDVADTAQAGAGPQRSQGETAPAPQRERLPAHRLPALLEGAELAAARLIVASFDIDVTAVGTPREPDHGEAEGAAHA